MNGSSNTIAFYTMRLYMDDSLQAAIKLDNIGYEETRYVNAYIDYKSAQMFGLFQCLFKLRGNRLDHIYEYLNKYNGGLDLRDGKTHTVDIQITDDKKNRSHIHFYVKGSLPERDEISIGWFLVGNQINFERPGIKFQLDEKQLYDDVNFKYSVVEKPDEISNEYSLHYAYVPLHHYFNLKIKANRPVPPELRGKIAMLHRGRDEALGKATLYTEGDWYEAKVREFGKYWLCVDTVAPAIQSKIKDNADLSKADQISFTSKAMWTSIKKFRGEIDGNWVCFEQHGDNFFYTFDEHCPKGKHELVFTASDENNNSRTVHFTFTR